MLGAKPRSRPPVGAMRSPAASGSEDGERGPPAPSPGTDRSGQSPTATDHGGRTKALTHDWGPLAVGGHEQDTVAGKWPLTTVRRGHRFGEEQVRKSAASINRVNRPAMSRRLVGCRICCRSPPETPPEPAAARLAPRPGTKSGVSTRSRAAGLPRATRDRDWPDRRALHETRALQAAIMVRNSDRISASHRHAIGMAVDVIRKAEQ